MDINDTESQSTTSLELTHPATGEKCGIIVFGYTPDSAEYRRIEAKVMGKKMAQSLIIASKKGEGNRIEIDPAQAEKNRQVMIETITAISGITDGGKPVEFDADSRIEFLSANTRYWITDQWREHIDDRANFFGKPAKGARSGAKA